MSGFIHRLCLEPVQTSNCNRMLHAWYIISSDRTQFSWWCSAYSLISSRNDVCWSHVLWNLIGVLKTLHVRMMIRSAKISWALLIDTMNVCQMGSVPTKILLSKPTQKLISKKINTIPILRSTLFTLIVVMRDITVWGLASTIIYSAFALKISSCLQLHSSDLLHLLTEHPSFPQFQQTNMKLSTWFVANIHLPAVQRL